MRANSYRILPFAAVRGVLHHLAHALTGLDQDDVAEVLATLIGEVAALQQGDTSADIWRQATADLTAQQAYGLERLGLRPLPERNMQDV